MVFILATDLVAVAICAFALSREALSPLILLRFGLLLAGAVCYAECADRVERLKRYLGSDRMWSNHTSVWALAAVVLLPVGLACLVVALVYGHALLMGYRHRSVRPHRVLFSAAAMLVAVAAAGGAHSAFDPHHMFAGLVPSIAALVAIVVFHVVDLVVLVAGMYLAVAPPTLGVVLPSADAMGFEAVTQVLGLIVAQLIVYTPWLSPAALVLLAVLHRASLVKELRVAASIDTKTSLLNAAAWRDRAQQALSGMARRAGPVAVLIVDLDHFKMVNDDHGHLVGDHVLKAVAACVRAESRAHDVAGRFGGDELVLMLDGAGCLKDAVEVAERLRSRIAELELPHSIRLTASIGLAYCANAATYHLDAVLAAADAALYEGKSDGRDRVHSTVMNPLASPRSSSPATRS